jgi:hypothetical protein
VAHYLVAQRVGMPGFREPEQARITAGRLIDSRHVLKRNQPLYGGIQ